MTRLPRAKEVAEAAEYVFGCSVHHTGTSKRGRTYLAKATYWQALAWFGYSPQDIADAVGADRHTVHNGLSKAVEDDWLHAVVERASALVYNEPCVEDVREVRTDVHAPSGGGSTVRSLLPPSSHIRSPSY